MTKESAMRGQDYLTCISQPIVSKILHKVINALNILMEQWIRFSIEKGENQRVKETYWRQTQFSGIIGAVDGIHVAIFPPSAEREHLYINRKFYHLLNVLLVSDYEDRILTVNNAYGGRTHDARVWRASLICNHLEEMYTAGRDACLLGDSAYPLSYLMTPKLHEPEGIPSARYTQHYVRARSSVERCIGVLKRRWRAAPLLLALYNLFSARIVNTACVLHNIDVHWRLPEPELYYDVIDQEFPIRYENGNIENGNKVREQIIHIYYEN
ncbi:putative nuclease HARBI1 [Polyergus mexicanus]|uniref:putative nuclease HARBI1 n=1 Tax=Polyergus mexicanus TaxID=615972 RepID=UPI0038B48052